MNLREKLIKHAEGVVLETNCGSFRNRPFLSLNEKVKGVIGIDWCNEMLDLAAIQGGNLFSKFVKMDSSNMEYQDNSFDTVVDTFGLQSNYDPVGQFTEMKRVCKKGGKILLLEVGLSSWKTTVARAVDNAENELVKRGQVLFYDYDNLVLNDPEVKVIKRKRKLAGNFYFYVLEKL